MKDMYNKPQESLKITTLLQTMIGLILLWVVIFSSCREIIEENLSDEVIILNSPPNGITTDAISINFWWEKLEGADSYHLQVVSPRFDSIVQLILDTNTTATQYLLTLHPGTFQWRVKGKNSEYETAYTTYTLTIDSTNDLSSQTVILSSPADNYVTNDTSVTFFWWPVTNATGYRFEIGLNDGTTQFSQNITTTSLSIPYFNNGSLLFSLSEEEYVWTVIAYNSISQSPGSFRSIEIDTTAPDNPVLTSPLNNVTLTDSTVVLKWKRGDYSGSTIKDSLFIYGDSLYTQLKTGQYLSDTTYQYTIPGSGSYFWFVRSYDAAGNRSWDYSQVWKFNF